MKEYGNLTTAELTSELEATRKEYDEICALKLSLDLTRGKPATEQLDLSDGMFATINNDFVMDGVDVRNYGMLGGLPSTKKLFAELLDCKPEQVFIGGSASLAMMYDLISKAMVFGLPMSVRPWDREEHIRFMCPVPGYDRHFTINRSFGFEMIPIPMTEDGPDMDLVEKYANEKGVKGIWCVPKYSNPDGFVYSEETCKRFASMKTAEPDFLIMWDNAYCVHSLYGEPAYLPSIISLCAESGSADRVFEFASTSKVTYAGSGISAIAGSQDNIAWYKKLAGAQIISYSKLMELAHVRFLKDKATTVKHMAKHAEILRPKFEAVISELNLQLAPRGIAHWHDPKGGYFVSLYVMPHTAKRVAKLCLDAGVKLTAAGATYPGGEDPEDSNLRIAPSYAQLDDVKQAAKVLCIAARLAALEQLAKS